MKLLVILLIAIVLFAGVVWLFKRRSSLLCPKHIVINRALYDDVKDQIKAGDLLLFSFYRYNFFTRTFGNPIFAHTGMVVEIDGELYSYEMVEYDFILLGGEPEQNTILVKLEDRIRDYPGNVFLASLKQPLTRKQKTLLDEFVRTRTYKFTSRWRLLPLAITNITLENERFCSEFTATILDYLGVACEPIKERKFKLHRSVVNLCGTDIYYEPVQLVPNNFVHDLRNHNQVHYASFCDKLRW